MTSHYDQILKENERLRLLLVLAKQEITLLMNQRDACWHDWDTSYAIDEVLGVEDKEAP